jgi:hypothetical protein
MTFYCSMRLTGINYLHVSHCALMIINLSCSAMKDIYLSEYPHQCSSVQSLQKACALKIMEQHEQLMVMLNKDIQNPPITYEQAVTHLQTIAKYYPWFTCLVDIGYGKEFIYKDNQTNPLSESINLIIKKLMATYPPIQEYEDNSPPLGYENTILAPLPDVFQRLIQLLAQQKYAHHMWYTYPYIYKERDHHTGIKKTVILPHLAGIATLSERGTTHIWNVFTNQNSKLMKSTQHAPMTALAYAPDGNSLAIARGKIIDLYTKNNDLSSKKNSITGHSWAIHALTFAPHGQELTSISIDGTARVWDIVTNQCTAVFNPHNGPLLTVAYAPDGKTIAIGAKGGTIYRWKPRSNTIESVWQETATQALVYSCDNRWLASTAYKLAILRDPETYHIKKMFSHQAPVTQIAFCPEAPILASSDEAGTIYLRNIDTYALTKINQDFSPIVGLGFSPSGEFLASSSAFHTTVFTKGSFNYAYCIQKLINNLNNKQMIETILMSPIFKNLKLPAQQAICTLIDPDESTQEVLT